MTTVGGWSSGKGTSPEVEIEGRRLRLSSLDRVLWPLAGYTKGQMIDYYMEIAPVLVPHIAGRPLTLRRFPEGVDQLNWYQTQCRGRPDWLPTHPIKTASGETHHYCLVNDPPSLVWVANLGTIELHPLLAPAARPDRPTVVVFDLDPGPPADVLNCCEIALWLRNSLEADGLVSFVKTSGSFGLHVYVPLNSEASFDQTKSFARATARSLSERHPNLIVDKMTKSIRAGRVLIDWLQNDPTRSTVAPYSLRGMAWPTVSTPVTWNEIERALALRRPELLTFAATDVTGRLAEVGDLFQPVLQMKQSLPM
ncbi:MAG: non-homologous end-joining DNA ligase [Actinomycetota bacterium]|nr:non-homologous end-joining DNA ligase [Actinomycetota bacterium]